MPVEETDAVVEDDPPPLQPLDRDHELERVHRAEWGRLVGLARLLLDRAAEAEEVVQDAFVGAYAGWDRIRRHDDVVPYLRRAVVNRCRDQLRRRAVARRRPLEVVRIGAPADEAVQLAESQRELAAALRRLPERQRECVVLRYLLDCTTAETATVLGIAEGSVKTHLSRALAALETDLEATR